MGELKFNRYEGFIGGGTGTKFIDENFNHKNFGSHRLIRSIWEPFYK